MSKIAHLQTILMRTLADIYRTEVKDDAIGFLTITEVRLTNDYSYMTIYYTVLGDEKKKDMAKEALERSKGFVKKVLATRINMRKMPQLKFKYDESLEYGNRIEDGLKKVLKKDYPESE